MFTIAVSATTEQEVAGAELLRVLKPGLSAVLSCSQLKAGTSMVKCGAAIQETLVMQEKLNSTLLDGGSWPCQYANLTVSCFTCRASYPFHGVCPDPSPASVAKCHSVGKWGASFLSVWSTFRMVLNSAGDAHLPSPSCPLVISVPTL